MAVRLQISKGKSPASQARQPGGSPMSDRPRKPVLQVHSPVDFPAVATKANVVSLDGSQSRHDK